MASDTGTIRLDKTLSFSWEIFVDNLGSLLILAALAGAPGLILQVFTHPLQMKAAHSGSMAPSLGAGILAVSFVGIAVMFLVQLLTVLAMAVIVQQSVLDKDVSLGSALSAALPRLLPGFGTILLGMLLLMGWSLLLVIPGMIFALYYMFQVQAVALRGESFMGAIRYSKNLVKGYWWRLAWILFVCTMLGILVVGVPLTASVFFITNKIVLAGIYFVLNVAFSSYFNVVLVVLFLALECLKGQGIVGGCSPAAEGATPLPDAVAGGGASGV